MANAKPNLAVATPSRVKSDAKPTASRAIVRAAAAKVATKSKDVAKRAGRAVVRGTVKGGAFVARNAVRGGRALGRAAKENWKTIALHEGVGLTGHVGTFFADRKAKQTYLRAFEGMPMLQAILKPSTLFAGLELLGLALTKGNIRKVLRELLRGTLHAKTGLLLHEKWPDAPATQARGIDDDDEELAGPPVDDEDVAGPPVDDEDVAGPPVDDEELAGPPVDDEDVIGAFLDDEPSEHRAG